MIEVAPQSMAAEPSIVELTKAPADFVWIWTQVAPIVPTLMVSSPLNAILDEGISWEDAEWQ